MTYQTVFLVITLAVLAPVFTLILRKPLSFLCKRIFSFIMDHTRRNSKLRYKLIENTKINYNDDFYILLGIVIMFGIAVLIRIFGE